MASLLFVFKQCIKEVETMKDESVMLTDLISFAVQNDLLLQDTKYERMESKYNELRSTIRAFEKQNPNAV